MFQGADLALLTKTWHFLCQHLAHVKGFVSFVVTCTVQLGKTKAIKHCGGVVVYFCNHFSPNLSKWKEGNHDSYLWLWANKGVAPNLFVYVVRLPLFAPNIRTNPCFKT